jgi:DNA repair exonuclease SbcCD ATPase subunit
MYITFTKLRYKNFIATGNVWTEIALNEYKNTLVVGTNGNGKSTFIDAICFALFNKPFRKINKPQLVNSINKKNCLVEIEFRIGNKEYLIRRGIKPAIFEVVVDGITMPQDAESRDHQDLLEKTILKMNFKTFCQVVVLGSATYVPFMQLPAAARREVIEDLLDLQIFTTMNVIVKDQLLANKTVFDETETQGRLLKQKIDLLKRRRNEIAENNSEFIAENEKKIADRQNQIEATNAEIAALNEQKVEYTAKCEGWKETVNRLDEVTKLRRQLEHKQEMVAKETKFLSEHDDCPTCKQTIDTAFKCAKIEEKDKYNQEVTDAISKLGDRARVLQKKIDEFSEFREKISNINNEIASKTAYIRTWQDFIKTLEKQNAQQIQKASQQLDDNELTDAEESYKVAVKKYAELKAERSVLTQAAAILKDGGIKTTLIKKFIPIINQIINHYLTTFDFFVSFELDETFSETIKSRYRDEFSYNSFSEGEKKRIDLAIMLTWRAIARKRNSASTNLLIMDEVFDSSMDVEGVDSMIKVITETLDDNNIFVISHRENLRDKFEKVMTFKKVQNFSTLLQDE